MMDIIWSYRIGLVFRQKGRKPDMRMVRWVNTRKHFKPIAAVIGTIWEKVRP